MIKEKHTKGFTLVELLVVIAIIAVLVGALFLIINPAEALKATRDSRREANLTELHKAMSLVLADNKGTVVDTGATPLSSCTAGTSVIPGNSSPFVNTGWARMAGTAAGSGGLSAFMSALPLDPSNGQTVNGIQMCYLFRSDGTNWEINAYIESTKSVSNATNDGGNANSCSGVTLPSSGCRLEYGSAPGLTLI